VTDIVCMACKAGFCWCCASFLQTMQKKLSTAKQLLLHIILKQWTTKN